MFFSLFLLTTAFISPVFAEGTIQASIKRLNSITKAVDTGEVDKKLLKAVGIIDKMNESSKWLELRKIIDVAEFKYSSYYDELLYLYLSHVANEKNQSELDALWQKMSAIQDSVHLFPAMLARLFSQKDIRSAQYRKELTLLLQYIETAPAINLIHGPMIEGNILFGYKIREDFSTGELPQIYYLKDYIESPRPLPGFSDDTQYIGLLVIYNKYIGFVPERVEKLARLYEAGGNDEKAAGEYFKLATYYEGNKQHDTANISIMKAFRLNPKDASINELKRKIELSLVLISNKQTAQFQRIYTGTIDNKYAIEMTLKRDSSTLSGDYAYKKIGTKIRIDGVIDDRNNFTINEFDDKGNQTGIFKGYFISDAELKGTWSKPSGDKSMPFSLKAEGD